LKRTKESEAKVISLISEKDEDKEQPAKIVFKTRVVKSNPRLC
jgi:hypothetical protein